MGRMIVENASFSSLEVALADLIASSLVSSVERTENLEINFFDIHNPVTPFYIFSSNFFHFTKIRSIHSDESLQNQFEVVLKHWIDMGASFEPSNDISSMTNLASDSANIINFDSLERTQKIISRLSSKKPFFIYSKVMDHKSDENIWSFMHPLWKLCDITGHNEVTHDLGSYFYLTCEKRE